MSEENEIENGVFDDGVDEVEETLEQEEVVEEKQEVEEKEKSDEPESKVEEVKEDDEKTKAQKQIAAKAFEARKARREAEELRKRIEELESKTQSAELQMKDVPPIPETWDEDFEAKMKKRDEILLNNARVDALESQRREAEAERERQAEQERAKKEKERQRTFIENSEKLGLSIDKLAAASQVVAVDYGISVELEEAILEDPHGALVLQHLSQNYDDLEEISKLSGMKLGFKFADIKNKVVKSRVKKSSAPAPSTRVKSNATKEVDDSGATFE